MAVEIWPHIAPDQLKAAIDSAEKRELDWLIEELQEILTNLKHGLQDCYALLAPIDPGSTLVLSTPRNEIVKGHVTRVGTRIVKGTIHLRLRTLPHQTLTINPDHPIHLASLTTLHSLLTQSIDLLELTLSYSYPAAATTPSTPLPPSSPLPPPPTFLSAQLRLLSHSLREASALLKGTTPPSTPPSWTTHSAAPSHFLPPLTSPQPQGWVGGGSSSSSSSQLPALSFHLSVQDSSLVLWLRALEPADAPVHFGTKLALAIGTARRLEHDESEKVFGFCCGGDGHADGDDHDQGGGNGSGGRHGSPGSKPVALSGTGSSSSTRRNNNSNNKDKKSVDVFVREKVRVESADPSLLSLSAKLAALSHTLALARRNLAAVMGEEMEALDD